MEYLERSFSIVLKKSNLKKTCAILMLYGLLSVFCFSQNIVSSPLLRFPIWFVLEESPSLASPLAEDSSVFSTATSGIRSLSPFFIEGLVYGWEFSYTPSDIVRGVDEYFEMTSIIEIAEDDPNMRFTDAMVGSGASVVEAWVEYDMSNRMIYERHRWHTAAFPSIAGRGEASVFDGIGSVKLACENAAKNAIRNYSRNIIKNKPKEIRGKILLTDFPYYYIDAGKYVADLDFFLNVSKIVEYTIY